MTLIDRTRSATALGRAIEAGRADPREIIRESLERIRQADSAHEIFVRLTGERGLAEADAAADRAKRGVRRSMLDGVPISYKDNFDIAGMATGAGSRLLTGRVPHRDAEIVARLARGGLVTLGKTNMVELAFSGLGLNPVTGTPRNPFDRDTARLPGGSSSGAAVSVSRGLAPLAIGTDTGGSVRIPAAWNDLVGLKTTAGLLPLEGVTPLSPIYDTVGPLTVTVEDAAETFALMARERMPPLTAAAGDIHVCVAEFGLLGSVEPAVTAAMEAAHQRLERAGFKLVRRAIAAIERLLALGPVPVAAEAYALWGAEIERRPGVVFDRIAERIMGGRDMTAASFLRYGYQLEVVRRAYLAETASFDGVLMPTVATGPLPIDEIASSREAYHKANPATLGLTNIANRLGLSALTLPAGFAGTPPLPTGLSILAPPLAERRLLAIGAAAERALAG